MSANPDAATIAASIDLGSVAGHNLRALLLRLLDGDEQESIHAHCSEYWAAEDDADALAVGLGLSVPPVGAQSLTILGRDVAEQLRPVQWRVEGEGASWALYGDGEASRLNFAPQPLPDRIAALLTADDLARAKAYRTEPGA